MQANLILQPLATSFFQVDRVKTGPLTNSNNLRNQLITRFTPPLVSTYTTDVCDANSPLLTTGDLQILQPIFQSYGGCPAFSGRVATVKSFEDNAAVIDVLFERQTAHNPDTKPNILVVDSGGSGRRSMVGGVLARVAHDMGWAGIVVNGSIRDVEEINDINIGVRALGPVPVRSTKKGGGEKHVPVQVGGVLIRDGDWLCADRSGIVVSKSELSLLGPTHYPVRGVARTSGTSSCVYGHVVADYTSPVEPHRLFAAHCMDDHNFLPKYLPDLLQSVEFLRGDSTTVGCIKRLNFAKGNPFSYVINRVDELDMEKMYMKYTTVEGDILGEKWEQIVYEIKVQPSITGSHYNMTAQYHTKRSADHDDMNMMISTEEELMFLREGLKNMHKFIQENLLLYPKIYKLNEY